MKPDATDDEIVDQINNEGAVGTFTVRPDGKITQAIPWKKALTARLSLDEDFQNRRLALQPFAGLVLQRQIASWVTATLLYVWTTMQK